VTTPEPSAPALAPHLDALWPSEGYRLRVRQRPRGWNHRETYLMVPGPSRPTGLLPTAPAAVASAALRDHGHASTTSARVRSSVLGALARLGVARLVPGTLVIDEVGAGGLIPHLSAELGVEVHVSVRLGPPRANRKPVLTLMRASGSVVGYTKVGVNDLTKRRIEAETAALAQLAAADLGTLVAPTVLSAGPWGEATYLTLSPLRSRSGGGIDPAVRDTAARDLVAAFPTRQHRLAESPWWRALRARVSESSMAEARQLDELAGSLEGRLGPAQLAFGAQHGDWTPWNLHTVDGVTHVWDWERFASDAPVGMDQLHYAFHTATAIRGERPIEALSEVQARVAELVRIHEIADTRALWAVYLVQAGERFLTDRQEDAGSKKGPLSTWLLPTLDRAVAELPDRD
jgi:hypothetical protein